MNELHDIESPLFHNTIKKHKKWPIILGGLVAVGLLGWTGVSLFFKIKFGDFQPPFNAPNVIVSIVETKTIKDQIEAIGTTKASNSATITASVTEVVTSLPVTDGQFVSKGNVIAILNDSAERATVAEASQAYNRYNELAKLKIASNARRDEEEARLQVAESSLAERVIRAPFDGVLGMVNVDVGDLVSPGVMITTIDNLDPLEIEFSIPEQDIANVAVEMPITATSEAYKGEMFEGKITALDTRIDPSTRALRVKAIIPNTDRRLKPGMLMKTNIIKETRPAMILPEGVILSKGNQKSVLAIGKNDKKEDIAVEKIVTLGSRQSGFVEIKSGLTEGDKIIVEGQLKAQPDTQVKVIETKSIDELVGMAVEYSVERKREALTPATIEEPKPQEEKPTTASEPEPEVKTEVEKDTSEQAVSPLRINSEATNTNTKTGAGE